MIAKHESHTEEAAARFGAKANACLGLAQLAVAALTRNFGFVTEAAHQAADTVSLGAKANAMNKECTPRKAYRLRKWAASILLTGGLVGVGGGAYRLATETNESSAPLELVAAYAGAGVNTVIARRSHRSHRHTDHTDDSHAHAHGAASDSFQHMMLDMGTGWAYASSLTLERYVPGITNGTLVVAGVFTSSVGIGALRRNEHDNNHLDLDNVE